MQRFFKDAWRTRTGKQMKGPCWLCSQHSWAPSAGPLLTIVIFRGNVRDVKRPDHNDLFLMVKMTLSLKSFWPDCGPPSQYELKSYVV